MPADMVSVMDTTCDKLSVLTKGRRSAGKAGARAGLTPFYRFSPGTGGIITTPGELNDVVAGDIQQDAYASGV